MVSRAFIFGFVLICKDIFQEVYLPNILKGNKIEEKDIVTRNFNFSYILDQTYRTLIVGGLGTK